MAFTKINAAGIGTTETVTIDGLTVINDGSFGGNLTVGGVLTYEDVTNVDSVGLITARNGIVVGSGITLSKDGDIFFTGIMTGNGSGLTNLATDLVNDTSPQLGGTLDVNGQYISFPDSNGTTNQARFGTGDDLKIYHQSDSSYIINATGNLNIGSNNAVRILGGSDVAESMAVFTDNGAVELYNDNNKRFETTAGGVIVTGTLGTTDTITSGEHIKTGTDDGKFLAGASNDLQIYHDGTHSRMHSASHAISIRAGGVFGVFNGDGTETLLSATPNGAVELYHDNSKKFETGSGGIVVTGQMYSNSAQIVGAAGGDAELKLFSDAGSQAADKVRIRQTHVGNSFLVESFANGGSYQSILKGTDSRTIELHYQGTKMIETISTGTRVPDGKFARFGDGEDMAMGHNTYNYITYTGNELRITGDSTNAIRLMPKSDETAALFNPNGNVILYYNNTEACRTINTNRVGLLVGDQQYINESIPHGELIVRKNLSSPNNASIEQCARITVITNEITAGGNGYGGALFFGAQDVSTTDQYTYRLGAIGTKLHNSADLANTTPNGDMSFFVQNSSLYERARLRHDGYLFLTNTSIQSLSDIRLKENIEDYSFDLDKFKQFKPVTFNWKKPEYHTTTPKSGKHRGFIAQDVQKLDSYALVNEYDLEIDSKERELVDEDAIALTSTLGDKDAMYVSVIQQLIDKVEKLETRIKTLEG